VEDTPSKFVIAIVRTVSLGVGKLFWRVKFHDRKNIPRKLEGGLIVVANHQSYLDPFLICAPIKRPMRFMAWDKAFEWFFVGSLLRSLGAFPVDIEKSGSIGALKKGLRILKNGETLVVFPEASREFSDGKLLPFRTGAARLAIETGAPILPVTIKGANHVWSRDHKFPRFGKIDVFYHEILRFPAKQANEIHRQVEEANILLQQIISSV